MTCVDFGWTTVKVLAAILGFGLNIAGFLGWVERKQSAVMQDRIGAKGAWGFDLVAACSGFLYGLTTAAHLVMAGAHKKVLVIGADTMSRIIDYTDRNTCVLFGDAAGAMLIEPAEAGGLLRRLHEGPPIPGR